MQEYAEGWSDPADPHRHSTDPRVLARVRGLEFRARLIVEGFISGLHRSPYRGFSIEFAEHRKYTQGDDLRHLDWRMLGRTDKHYVKQYDQDTNLRMLFVLDRSASMDYRSDREGLSKREYGAALVAAMAYLALQQSDAVGLAVCDDSVRRLIRASNSPAQWKTLLHEMEAPRSASPTRLRPVLDELAETLRRRHVVVLVSDLFDEPRAILGGLRHLCHRRHEAIVFHVLDRAELEFPFSQSTRFEDLESRDTVRTEPRVVRQRYRREIGAFLDEVRRGCLSEQIDYALFQTGEPLDKALVGYLVHRAGGSRETAAPRGAHGGGPTA